MRTALLLVYMYNPCSLPRRTHRQLDPLQVAKRLLLTGWAQLPVAVWENEPKLLPPSSPEGRMKTGLERAAEIEPTDWMNDR